MHKLSLALVFFVVAFQFFTGEATKDPLTVNGRSVFVHLFEWKWSDIAAECERFLGPKVTI